MRLVPAVLASLTCLLVPVACSSTKSPGENVIRESQPIQGGTVDQTDRNVVAILIGQNGQVSSLCSGSLIGPNLVLTAHHCVASPPNNLACGGQFSTSIIPASDFAVTTSYDAAEQVWLGSSGAMPTLDGVTWWRVSTVNVPTTNDVCSGDQAMLTLSSSISGVCPLIPAVDVLPTEGEAYTAIGFGITSPQGQTPGTRYKLSSGVSVQCVGSSACGDTTIGATGEWEGGASGQEGTCEGDSGGPALDSLGRIIGTVSRGPSNACNSTVYESTYDYGASPSVNGGFIKQIAAQAATAGGYTAAGWVTGGATSNPANGYCPSSVTDAGTMDSGTGATDSGATSDAGTEDAGTVTEGGDGVDGSAQEAGEATEAGTGADGGAHDAGVTNADAGTPASDSGGPSMGGPDSGTASMDGSVGPDASSTEPDASAADAGGSPTSGNSGGCSCKAAGTGPTSAGLDGGLAFATLAGVLSMRRRRHERGMSPDGSSDDGGPSTDTGSQPIDAPVTDIAVCAAAHRHSHRRQVMSLASRTPRVSL